MIVLNTGGISPNFVCLFVFFFSEKDLEIEIPKRPSVLLRKHQILCHVLFCFSLRDDDSELLNQLSLV